MSAQSRPNLCDPVDFSPPGSSVYGIVQASVLEWVAISSCRGSSQPSDELTSPVFPALAGWFFTTEPRGNPPAMQEMQEIRVWSPAGGNGNPLQYSCLENPLDRGVWKATVHEVSKSWTWLSDWAYTHMYICMGVCLYLTSFFFLFGCGGS